MESSNNDILKLNVGGKYFATRRGTLCAVEGSMLENMFRLDSNFASPTETEGGEIFLDRNPVAFGYILDYLRDGCRLAVDLSKDEAMLQRLRADADYFGLEGLVGSCDAKLLRNAKAMLNRNGENYEYKQTYSCNSPGPGWKLSSIIPSELGKIGMYPVCTKFIFEKMSYDPTSTY